MENTALETKQTPVISSEILLGQWQGHRRLTRKMIEAFPEDKLFTYSVGGMRPFGTLVIEMLTMAGPGIKGMLSGKWDNYSDVEKSFKATTRAELLKLWDEATEQINELFPKLTPERFHETVKVFGQYEGPVYWSIFYFIDNEIHHRGQGYVYLRSLGIEPPAFWDRY